MLTVMLLTAALASFGATVAAAMESDAKAAFDRAMAAVAGSPIGSTTEARAMGQAIAAVAGLAGAPAIPDAAIRYVGRAEAAARRANTPAEFLDAAKVYGEGARVAPWVAEYQFNRGVLLQKAEHYKEAALALGLYLEAAPDAKDATEVRALIAGLRRIQGEPTNKRGTLPPSPPEPGAPRHESHRAGETFRDCSDCPEMVAIPAGRVTEVDPDFGTGGLIGSGSSPSW